MDQIKENGFTFKKAKSRRYPAETMTNADYANDPAVLTNTSAQIHWQGIGFYMKADKIECMNF